MRSFAIAISSLFFVMSASAFAGGAQTIAILEFDFSGQQITDPGTGIVYDDSNFDDLTIEVFGVEDNADGVTFFGEIVGVGLSRVKISHRHKEPGSLFYVTLEEPQYYSSQSSKPWGVDLFTAFITVVEDSSPDHFMISGHYSGFVDRLGGIEWTRGGSIKITITNI